MTNEDAKRVGAQLRAVREAMGVSQADLAELMTERGQPGWYPQTVTKVEKGLRTLKWTEGLALTAVLGVDPTDLSGSGLAFDENQAAVRRYARALQASSRRVEEAFTEVRQADANLQSLIDQLELEGNDRRWVEAVLRGSGAVATARLCTAMAPDRLPPQQAPLAV